MTVPKAPSWTIVIVAGLCGGGMNMWLNSPLIGFIAFAIVSAILMLISNRWRSRARCK